MKKFFLFLFCLLIFAKESYSRILLPEDIYFHVYRNGTKIGFHKINFSLETNENELNKIRANIEINFDVKFLGFSVYNYKHSNNEIWEIIPDELVSDVCKKCTNLRVLLYLDSVTNKNGSEFSCKIERNKKENVNLLSAIGGQNSVPSFSHIYTFPTSYWNFQLVTREYNKKSLIINETNLTKRKIVFNSQDCSKINFTIQNLGKEKIYNNLLEADRYKLKGKESSGEEVNIDIWYDNKENWVKMIFVKDGSEIEYFLDKYHEKR